MSNTCTLLLMIFSKLHKKRLGSTIMNFTLFGNYFVQ